MVADRDARQVLQGFDPHYPWPCLLSQLPLNSWLRLLHTTHLSATGEGEANLIAFVFGHQLVCSRFLPLDLIRLSGGSAANGQRHMVVATKHLRSG